ncbi:MAG: hypothetical protein JW942_06235 [Opitutales bacterium]|nr:hypothetical protein [Opitutales bacterium]
MSLPRIVVIRHPKEKRSKCSLLPLESWEGTFFHRGKPGFSMDGTGFLLLAPDAPLISPADAVLTPGEEASFAGDRAAYLAKDSQGRTLRPILLLDSTWRLLPGLRRMIEGTPLERSLPLTMKTAYPRVSKMTEDPDCGLATIEALYGALRLMGMDCPALLEQYRWRDDFLAQF